MFMYCRAQWFYCQKTTAFVDCHRIHTFIFSLENKNLNLMRSFLSKWVSDYKAFGTSEILNQKLINTLLICFPCAPMLLIARIPTQSLAFLLSRFLQWLTEDKIDEIVQVGNSSHNIKKKNTYIHCSIQKQQKYIKPEF